MKFVKIANVLLEDTRQFNTTPLLYVRSSQGVVPADEDSWMLQGPGAFDFTTFFNALSIGKYDEYTSAKAYRLHLELKGAAARVKLTCVDQFDYYSRPQREGIVEIAACGEWSLVDIDLSYRDPDVLVGFIIETDGDVWLRNGHYSALVEESDIREVNLALSTTTFKKEQFITRNIDLVRREILGSQEEIAAHFRMYVIDNGRTLDTKTLTSNGIEIYPNSNVGGSGGFAYGMLLAQNQGDVTHVLLMDDDVEVSPESIKRSYALLTIVNERYAEAFISGAMMNFDEPDIHWEDVGYMTQGGVYRSLKPLLRMSVLHDCTTSESFEPDVATWDDLKQRYAAWWYCCIPVSVIRKNGMPLPFFVRFDDAEYGMRCKPRIMTLNGICIWHLAFFMRYNAAVERYQTMRNGLVGQAITGVAPLTDFTEELRRNVMIELVKFNYADAELVLEGFEDYLAGPDRFLQKGFAEKRFMDANRNKEKQLPFAELRELVKDQFSLDLEKIGTDEILRDLPLGGRLHGLTYNLYHTRLFERSLNGQLYGKLRPFGSSTAVIEGLGWACPYGKLYGVDNVIAINIQQKVGVIRHRDARRARVLWRRFQEDLRRYGKEKSALNRSNAEVRAEVTYVDFWRDYLDI